MEEEKEEKNFFMDSLKDLKDNAVVVSEAIEDWAAKTKDSIANTFEKFKDSSAFKTVVYASGGGSSMNQEEIKNVQIEYHEQISKILMGFLKNLNSSGLPKLLENSDVSYPNLLFQDFSYRFVGKYKVDSESSDELLTYFCSLLAKVIYENKYYIKKHLEAIFVTNKKKTFNIEYLIPIKSSTKKHDTFASLVKFVNSDLIYVAFRGTKLFSEIDWSTDFMFQNYSLEEDKEMKCHKGFYSSLCTTGEDGESVFDKIHKVLDKVYDIHKHKIITCGHSLGGAMASLFCILTSLRKPEHNVFKVFTFGAPNIGNESFVQINKERCIRVINDLDIIPAIPQFMKPHGRDILVTKFLPVKFQQGLRDTLPVLSLTANDHYPGLYYQNIGKMYGFINGESNWKKFVEKLKHEHQLEKIEDFKNLYYKEKTENSKLRTKISSLSTELEKMKLLVDKLTNKSKKKTGDK